MDYYREVLTDDPFRRSERENPRTVETSQAMRCGVRGSANPSDREGSGYRPLQRGWRKSGRRRIFQTSRSDRPLRTIARLTGAVKPLRVRLFGF
jgi:hypothetical protein